MKLNLYFTAMFGCWLLPVFALAQDSIFMSTGANGRGSVVRGKITATAPFAITIKSSNGKQDITPDRVKRVSYGNEPSEIGRARSRAESGRYDDCLTELEKIQKKPSSKFIQQEIDYLKAFATAQKALRGDPSVSSQQAGTVVNKFVQQNPDSFHVFPARELLGMLLIAVGKPELATAEFEKLSAAPWSEYSLRGSFHHGRALLLQNKLNDAKPSFAKISSSTNNDDASQQYRLLAQCELAKISALEGKSKQAIEALEKIIKEENPDNSLLFAHAYNALGTSYLQDNQLKAAARAFLHTELLFSSESDPHAEALYNLLQIWRKLQHADRASQAQSVLKSRHRNSYWAQKL